MKPVRIRAGALANLKTPCAARWRKTFAGFLLGGWFVLGQLQAVTLEELVNDPHLTPKRFASKFSNFEFAYHPELQMVKVFLLTESGDCADYSTLADQVLRPKGYDTRLIEVRMPGSLSHAVCYVIEEKGYLDYNNRSYFSKFTHCGASIRQIANSVAKSFRANWTSASEYIHRDDGLNELVATVVKTQPPETDPPFAKREHKTN
jgi:hypothetical protein